MSTVVDDPPASALASAEAAGRLQQTMAAVRLSFTWLGVRRTLTPEQKEQAADAFGASGKVLSAGKKLLDTSHPAFKAVTSVRTQAVQYWKSMSLPYPEPGLRLIRQGRIEVFDERMREFCEDLVQAVAQLDRRYAELKTSSRQRLGNLYSESDYPATLTGLFGLEWDYPSVEPPDYLRQLHPELYEEECRRVRARFDEAVQLAEEAFLAEFNELIAHLCERLSGRQDGKPKTFRDSTITNLTEFFARFRDLNVGSSAELERLVAQAQEVVRGVAPQELRDDGRLRRSIATELAGVQSVLDGLLVDRPRRNIVRPPR
jgi:hypothetical protein